MATTAAAKPCELSRKARVFADKTARSIAEIQQSVNNMADVMVFLEVLGYDDRTAQKNGFDNLYELAKYIYNFMDAYDDSKGSQKEKRKKDVASSFELPVPSMRQRLAESLSMIFPWLGSLVMLFITGVSLWMAWGLPADVTIVFLGGVFLGLVITEGLLQNFNRLFSFYYSQTNIGEVKRSIKRSYALAAIILSATTAAIFGASALANVPFELATIAAISTVTISLHRVSYVVVYALKKLAHLAISYAGAFAALLAVFFLMPDVIPDVTLRYFAGLGSAFAVLAGFAVYHHYRIMGQNSISIVARNAPHFYSPLSVNDNTITSRFSVQLWECLPYSMYGTFYFVMLFADRIISWIFNPAAGTAVVVAAANGTVLPLSFNSVYHIGADVALLVVLPAAIIQYAIMSPIYTLVHNRAVNLKVSESRKIDLFLRHSYRKLIAASVIVSVAAALVLNLFAPAIMAHLGGSDASMRILGFASAGAVLLTIFAANSVFMIVLNKIKSLALIALVSALVVAVGGVIVAQETSFENVVMAYLAATALAAAASTIVMAKAIANGSSRLFARFI